MAWYETKACELCGKQIGKKWFFQTKPRLVGPDMSVRDAAYVEEADASTLLATTISSAPTATSPASAT